MWPTSHLLVAALAAADWLGILWSRLSHVPTWTLVVLGLAVVMLMLMVDDVVRYRKKCRADQRRQGAEEPTEAGATTEPQRDERFIDASRTGVSAAAFVRASAGLEAEHAASGRAPAGAQGKTVLVADDDPDIVRSLALRLAQLGCEESDIAVGEAGAREVADAQPDAAGPVSGPSEPTDQRAEPPAKGSAGEPSPVSPGTKRPKILSIDDDPEISRSIAMRLESFAIEVISATSGMQGFWMALTDQPEVIVADLNMPDGQGNYILGRLRNHPLTAHVPVIILTCDASAAMRRELLALGAAAYLTKPVNWAALFTELGRHVRLPEELVVQYHLSPDLLVSIVRS